MDWEEMKKKFIEHGFKVRADGFDGEFMIASNGVERFEVKEMMQGMEFVTIAPSWW